MKTKVLDRNLGPGGGHPSRVVESGAQLEIRSRKILGTHYARHREQCLAKANEYRRIHREEINAKARERQRVPDEQRKYRRINGDWSNSEFRKRYVKDLSSRRTPQQQMYHDFRTKAVKNCDECGGGYTVRGLGQRYCSKRCTYRARDRRNRQNPEWIAWRRSFDKKRREAAKKPCPVCGNRVSGGHTFCQQCSELASIILQDRFSTTEMVKIIPQLKQLARSYQCLRPSKLKLKQLNRQLWKRGTVPISSVRELWRTLDSARRM